MLKWKNFFVILHKIFDPSAANFVNYFSSAFCTNFSLKITGFLLFLYIAICYWIVYNNTRRQQREFAESKNFLKNASRNILYYTRGTASTVKVKKYFSKKFQKPLDGRQAVHEKNKVFLDKFSKMCYNKSIKGEGLSSRLWKVSKRGICA